MAPRTSVSCGHSSRGLRPIKKRWSLALCKYTCTGHSPSFFARLKLERKKTPRCPILPGSCPPSTFSAEGLYFCVRYVNRCFPFAIITRSILCFYSVIRIVFFKAKLPICSRCFSLKNVFAFVPLLRLRSAAYQSLSCFGQKRWSLKTT